MEKESQQTCCALETEPPSHRKQLARLNRVGGQIAGIQKMIEQGRYCPDILTQLRATRAAVRSLEMEILKNHLQTCVAQAFTAPDIAERDKKIEELVELFYRYD